VHQIRFRPELRPGPRWGSLQRSDPLVGLRGPTSKGMEGKVRERRGGKGREEVEERQGTGELKGRGRDAREKGGKGRGKERKERRGREKR